MEKTMASRLDPESVINGPQVYDLVDPEITIPVATGHFILEQIRSGRRVLESVENSVVTLSFPS